MVEKPSLAEKLVGILEFVADKDEITTEVLVEHFGFTLSTGLLRGGAGGGGCEGLLPHRHTADAAGGRAQKS